MTEPVAPNEKLLRNLRWFLAHQDPEPPTRIHSRGVWHDETGGSKLGTPAANRDFERWLYLGAHATRVEVEETPCDHRYRVEGAPCPSCVEYDGDEPHETGVSRRERVVYRWPMRATLARVAGIRVPAGAPDYARTCSAIQRANGDLDLAIEMLTTTFPTMGDPEFALAHIATALNRVRARFGVEALDLRQRPKSESQLDAEAVA